MTQEGMGTWNVEAGECLLVCSLGLVHLITLNTLSTSWSLTPHHWSARDRTSDLLSCSTAPYPLCYRGPHFCKDCNSCVTAFYIIYKLMYAFLLLVSLNMNCTESTSPYIQSRSVCTGICVSVFTSTAFNLCVFLPCTVRKIAFTSRMVITVLQGTLITRLSYVLL